jgi:hypothetical protein
MRTYFSLLSALMCVLLMAAPASPQAAGTESDSRWSPWLGCWQLTLESRDYDDERPEGEVFVCLSPRANDMGVGVTTWADGAVVLTKTLVADGTEYPVEESGCEGWRSAEWSGDGHRLFMQSKLTCENAIVRTVSGVSMMVPGGTWADIQLIASGDRKELVIRRYRAADMSLTEEWEEVPQEAPASRSARLSAARALTIDDVIEASRMVDADVLEAILVESDTSIHVDSGSLIRLADSNVPVGIIDLMVALSYPERFEIRSRKAVSGGIGWGYDDFYGAGYDPYGYWYPFYFAPFGYYSYSYWYRPGGYYLLTPSEDIKPIASGGKMVKGHGYASVWPKEPTGKSRGGWFGSGGSSGSSGSKASGEGYSSGSGSRSTGRTAKPKNKN